MMAPELGLRTQAGVQSDEVSDHHKLDKHFKMDPVIFMLMQ